jgi:hypothetical protein
MNTVGSRLPALVQQKTQLENEFAEFTAYMTSRQDNFQKLNILHSVLNKDPQQVVQQTRTLSFSQQHGMFSPVYCPPVSTPPAATLAPGLS